MTPGPSLQELIDSVHSDSDTDDALEQLAQAARTVAGLEEVGDALLGHFVDQCRRSGRSWSEISGALGVSKQAAHKRFSAPTFERFTPRARAVLEAAPEEARELSHHFVGTEHLLLAQWRQPEGLGALVLTELGITREACVGLVATLTKPGKDPGDGTTPFTPKAVEALRRAVDEALRFGHNYIGTEHLLLALWGDPEAVAARILTDLGATYDQAKENFAAKLAKFVQL